MTFTCTVHGLPIAQGSKRAFKTKTGKVVLVEAAKRLRPWRQDVAETARGVMAAEKVGMLSGPVKLQVRFSFPRPKAHYGTGKRAADLRMSSPLFPCGRPDLSKLVRAVEDALTGIWYRDDAQICRLAATKEYGPPGVRIEAESLT